MMRLRRARPSDADELRKLDDACFPDDDPLQPDLSGEAWWIGTEDGRPVCYAGARAWIFDGERALYLCRAGVIPSARGRGYQRRLIRARVAHARREGLAEAWSYTAHTNTASANNLIREGFTLWLPARWGGYAHPERPTGDDAWLFWRRPTPPHGRAG